VQQPVTEDEENIWRRGNTQELESDPESDWIPGPDNTTKHATAQASNIFGIKGLGDGMLNTPPKRIYATATPSPGPETHNDSHPFIHVLSKRTMHTSQSHLRLPISSTPAPNQPASTNTPELLKFSHQNPFSAIQLNNQAHPLIRELSYSWEDSEVLHDTGLIDDGTSKLEVKKRLAGQDFEAKKRWEMKRFKKAGCDLSRYNRGDFGPRIGMGRL
jgi:ubiquitin-conjugating enzyme E2 S